MTQETQTIPLIETPDNFEVIRDKLCTILATETALQVALATAAEKPNPDDWKFRVFKERDNPWQEFPLDGETGDTTPIVNVWFDDSVVDESSSNRSTRQKHNSKFNIDVYAYAVTEETLSGHTPGDQNAAILSHHAVRLVRRILMHDKYVYLGLKSSSPDTMWNGRKLAGITAFKPQHDNGLPVDKVRAARLTIEVPHNETVDLETPNPLEIINIQIQYEVGGEVIAELEYDHSGT